MSDQTDQPTNPWAQASAGIAPTAKLRFVNVRRPERAEDLSAIEQQQLIVAGRRYDGQDLPIEARMAAPGGEWDEEDSFAGTLAVWDVVDETETVRCTAWFYRADSGTVFAAGTTAVVAEVIQCGLECQDATFGGQLIEAARELRARDPVAARDMNLIPPQGTGAA